MGLAPLFSHAEPAADGGIALVPQTRLGPTVAAPSAPAEAPRAPVRETGYAVANPAGGWWSAVAEETTPELQWPMSIATYTRMRMTDAQVAAVLRAVAMPLRRAKWYLDPAGASEDVVQHVATDLGLPVKGADAPPVAPTRTRERFSWAHHLLQVLEMLSYGHSMFEQQYRLDEAIGLHRLRKLGHRPASTLTRINVASDGGLTSIEQAPPAGWTDREPPTIPVGRLVAYVHERVGGNWRGVSLLRPAYKHWLLKDRLLRVGTETVERNGMGIPLYTGAESDNLVAGTELAQRWRAGATGAGAVPNGASLKLVGVDGDLPDALAPVKYHDEQIGRAVLAHFLNLNAQGGSYALASVQADTFVQSLQTLAEDIADTATQHVVEDLVDVNWGPSEPAPRLRFEEIGSRQAATAQAIALLVREGILNPDDALEQAVRGNLGLPASTGRLSLGSAS